MLLFNNDSNSSRQPFVTTQKVHTMQDFRFKSKPSADQYLEPLTSFGPLSLAERRLVHSALQHASLRHLGAPAQQTKPQSLTYLFDDNMSLTYEFLSPLQTGFTAAELTQLFEYDQDQPFEETFEHPYFEDLAHLGMQDTPLFDEAVPLSALSELRDGIDAREWSARYCLVSRDDAGRIVGFVEFALRYSPVLGEDTEDDSTLSESESDSRIASFYFDVELTRIYTRKLFRGQGVGHAMIRSISAIVTREMASLAKQLAPVYDITERPFIVYPSVVCDWTSKTGKMAMFLLMDDLSMELDKLADSWSDDPNLECLEFEPLVEFCP